MQCSNASAAARVREETQLQQSGQDLDPDEKLALQSSCMHPLPDAMMEHALLLLQMLSKHLVARRFAIHCL